MPGFLKRRRFRFSLRTLLLAMAVVGCGGSYLASQLNWLRQREAFRLEMNARARPVDGGFLNGFPTTAPGLLWLFGERGAKRIRLAVVVDEYDGRPFAEWPDVQRAAYLFPEATQFGGVIYNRKNWQIQLDYARRRTRRKTAPPPRQNALK